MKTLNKLELAAASLTQVLSLKRKKVLAPLKIIPGLGSCMDANTCSLAKCPGGCVYCFSALKIRSDEPQEDHFIRMALGDENLGRLIRAINIVKPDNIATAEKIELGFCKEAIEEIRTLRKGVRPETFLIFTTKFPSVWKELDMPGTGMLVTLSNIRNVPGLEPNVPTFEQRLAGALEAMNSAKFLKVGIRILVMQREDIDLFRKLLQKHKFAENLVWVDFLRSPFAAASKKFENAISGHLNMDQYIPHSSHGTTLRHDIIDEAVKKLSPYGVIFDRLPVATRNKYSSQNVRVVRVGELKKCYVRADGSPCIQGACSWQRLCRCTGAVPPLDDTKARGLNQWAQDGGFCLNLTTMSLQQLANAQKTWDDVERDRSYAYGAPNRGGKAIMHGIIATLHSKKLLEKIKFNVSENRLHDLLDLIQCKIVSKIERM